MKFELTADDLTPDEVILYHEDYRGLGGRTAIDQLISLLGCRIVIIVDKKTFVQRLRERYEEIMRERGTSA
ncbi:MAG: hypothetical protein V1926_03455 [Candidatus Peregrinibacteria bacterium]